jgi:hypothetical protein
MDQQNQYCENGYTIKSNLCVQCNSHHNSVSFLTEIEKSILKFIWKYKILWLAKAILGKKSNAGENTISNYTEIAIKTAWYWNKNRHKDQGNRIKVPDRDQHSYAHLVFNKGTQNIWLIKDSFFNKCFWESWIYACTRLKLDSCLSPCTNISSKWIKDLNI